MYLRLKLGVGSINYPEYNRIRDFRKIPENARPGNG
jgi:hypothetical protein